MPEANYTQHWFYPQIWVPVWEEWMTVKGYESMYEVSTWGRFRSLDRYCGKRPGLVKGNIKHIYPPVPSACLWKDDSSTSRYIYHLVLEAFVGPCPEGMEACHFPDRNRTNNHLLNLRWDTHINNCKDREIHGTSRKGKPSKYRGELHRLAKLNDQKVREIRHLYAVGRYNQVELAAIYDIDQTIISDVVRRKQWKHVD